MGQVRTISTCSAEPSQVAFRPWALLQLTQCSTDQKTLCHEKEKSIEGVVWRTKEMHAVNFNKIKKQQCLAVPKWCQRFRRLVCKSCAR